MSPHHAPDPGIVVMAAKAETGSTANLDEEKLAHALVSRGLLTREEVQKCRRGSSPESGPEALLARLVQGGFLTTNQAQRVKQELPSLVNQQIPGYQLLEKLGQ